MKIPKLTGQDNLIKSRLEEGYPFTLLSRELGVDYRTLTNYVKGLDRHNRKRYAGIGFRKRLTPRDVAERYGISVNRVSAWLRRGRVKGRKVGHQWVITEWPSQADLAVRPRPRGKTGLLRAIFDEDNTPESEPEDGSIDRVLSTLSPIERFVIEQHFLRNVRLAEIARTYLRHDGRVGVARQMVWEIKERGLQKLKHPARLKILLGQL